MTTIFFSDLHRRELNYILNKENDINGRTQYSSACFGNAKFSKNMFGKYLSGKTTDEENKKLLYSIRFTKAFIQFLYKNTNLATKINSKYLYKNLLFALLNSNTNIFLEMDSILKTLTEFLTKNKEKLNLEEKDIKAIKNAYKNFTESEKISRTFFISTTLREETAVEYAMSAIENDQKNGFNPKYDKNGRPKHRNAGLVEIILYPATKYKQEAEKILQEIYKEHFPEIIDLHFAKMQGILKPNTRIEEQFESTFLNKIDGKYVVASFPIYFPDFSKEYDEEYFEKMYNINKKKYDEIKKLLSEEKYHEAMQKIIDILIPQYTKKVRNLANSIIEANAKQNSARYLPKIDENMEIKLEKSKVSCTIHNRFTKNAKNNNIDNKHPKEQEEFRTLISLNTSNERHWGFSRN